MKQASLFDSPAEMPDLASYDVIVVNSSAGKDSQAMLDYIVELAIAAGVKERLVVVHCDLGRMEWPGTKELAEKQAAHYGLRFEVVANKKTLLDRVRERQQWPDAARRFCTSELKTGQVQKLIVQLSREAGRFIRVLNCLGMRAEESPARAKKPVFSVDAATNSKRHVDRWLPIHEWSLVDVWARIKTSGVPHHYAYDKGMPRLSCCFCILASRSALVLSAKLNPALAEEYVQLEAEINHKFRQDLPIAEIVRQAKQTLEPVIIDNWKA
jgi:3'-phosphoadenosine 5'-phosphosulfate sulfotransferase (PAPS reductase)/FAD synthetase